MSLARILLQVYTNFCFLLFILRSIRISFAQHFCLTTKSLPPPQDANKESKYRLFRDSKGSENSILHLCEGLKIIRFIWRQSKLVKNEEFEAQRLEVTQFAKNKCCKHSQSYEQNTKRNAEIDYSRVYTKEACGVINYITATWDLNVLSFCEQMNKNTQQVLSLLDMWSVMIACFNELFIIHFPVFACSVAECSFYQT